MRQPQNQPTFQFVLGKLKSWLRHSLNRHKYASRDTHQKSLHGEWPHKDQDHYSICHQSFCNLDQVHQ